MARHVTIRTRLLRDLILLILIMGGAILATTFVGSGRAVRERSETLVGKTAEQMQDRLGAYFATPSRQLHLAVMQASSGLLDLDASPTSADPAAIAAAIRDRQMRLLLPMIQSHQQIDAIMIADERGLEHRISRTPDGWSSRIVWRDAWGDDGRIVDWTSRDGASAERVEQVDYDPRERPWYRDAVTDAAGTRGAAPQVHWTEPYIFYSGDEPGITASARLDLEDGLERVIAFDLPLSDLSEFTRSLRVGSRGLVAVLTDDGRLIGLPGLPQFEDPKARAAAYLKTGTEVEVGFINAATAAALHADGSDAETMRFDSGGEAWWGRASPFAIAPDRVLRVAVVVPEAELIGNAALRRTIILVILVAVLVVGGLRAMVLARRFSAPIERLVAQSDRMSRGDLEPGAPIDSELTEVSRLAEAHEQMREGLIALLKLEKIERDLDIARGIQRGLLPTDHPSIPGFEVDGWNQPADQTGGDYYDWMQLPDGRVIITVADVTGHGIGPALIVSVCRAYIRASAAFGSLHLAEAVTHVNDLLCDDTPSERFVTAVIVLLDPARGHATLVSAGHGPNIFYEAKRHSVVSWEGDIPPLGVVAGLPAPEPREIQMEAGDLLVLTTDGFFEWRNADDELYGTERLATFVREHHDLQPAALIEALYASVLDHAGGTDQADDLTAVVIRKT